MSPLQNARAATRTCRTTSTTPARSSRSARRRTPPTVSPGPGSRQHLDHHVRAAARPATSRSGTSALPAPTGRNVPSYISADCGSRWLVERDKGYDTLQYPAQPLPRAPTTATSSATTRRTRAVTSGPPTRRSRSWSKRRTTGAASSSACPASTRRPTCGVASTTRRTATPGYDPMTHMEYADRDRRRPGRPDHGRARGQRRARQHAGRPHRRPRLGRGRRKATSTATSSRRNDYGYYNWYYGDPLNDVFYDQPQEALLPLIDGTDDGTGETNVGLSYSDSSLNVWLKDQSSGAGRRGRGDHGGPARRHRRVAPRRRPLRPGLRRSAGTGCTAREKPWFARKAQELVDTQAADYGPDLIATLPDDTTYSVARRPRRHPASRRSRSRSSSPAANVSHKDLRAEVRSVDIMPTILRQLGIAPTYPMDGVAYALPAAR